MSMLRPCTKLHFILLAFFLLLGGIDPFGGSAHAQFADPVDWEFDKEELKGGHYKLHIRAQIDGGWHMYSQDLPEDAIPKPTTVSFEEDPNASIIGEVQEKGVATTSDPLSDKELGLFKEEAHFIQEVEVDADLQLDGSVEYMVCDDSQCLPPKKESFSFELEKGRASNEKQGDPKKDEKGKDPGDRESEGSEEGASSSEQAPSLDSDPIHGRDKAEKMADPVEWSGSVIRMDEDRYLLRARAKIDTGWHIYGTDLEKGSGPIPTSFRFQTNEGQDLKGKLWEEEAKQAYDEQYERELKLHKGATVFEQVLHVEEKFSDTVGAAIEFMACTKERCLRPKTIEMSFDLEGAEEGEPILADLDGSSNKKSSELEAQEEEKRGLLWTFILSFGGGFVALLTPCVFPMIPLTVSFFTKQSPTRAKGVRNAITYSASIVLIYTAIGYLITRIFGGSAMNVISTDPIVNILIFILILVFAISFLGGFDLNLPESWIDRTDKMADKGGLIGIFFMAFVLALVSFSCTAPIIGPLLFQTASQGGAAPLAGMFGFSLALALPFGLFAIFPAWLNSLPRSGGWMNTVKVTLGFLELALAFKFLSQADLVTQAGILKRELFLAIMIGVFIMMSMYLLGVFRTPNDDEVPKLSVPRVLFATLSLIFTLYLIPGLFGAPLKLISGYPPPLQYSEWSMGNSFSDGGSKEGASEVDRGEHCPQGLNCFNTYEKALSYAKKVDKPLMLDFTGHACPNCRRMEERVWSEEGIMGTISEEFVLASLYVDQRTELPEAEQKTVTLNGEKIELESVGDKWHYFQAKHYSTNTQPYYVLLDHEEERLVDPTGYEPDAKTFRAWLDKGLERFKKGS